MKFRVLFAAALFLHLVVHPMLHAADFAWSAPTQPTHSAAVAVSPAPQCAVCHLTNSLQLGPPVATVQASLGHDALLLASSDNSAADGIGSYRPSRAPPTL